MDDDARCQQRLGGTERSQRVAAAGTYGVSQGIQPAQRHLGDSDEGDPLGYPQDLLDRWYAAGRLNNADGRKRQHLVKALQRTKDRVRVALSASRDTDFGVRQEYRIRWDLFEALDLDPTHFMVNDPAVSSNGDDSDSSTPIKSPEGPKLTAVNLGIHATHSANPNRVDIDVRRSDERVRSVSEAGRRHRPYWVLPTREVNAYIAEDLNRWLFCLEVLMSRSQRGPPGLITADHEQICPRIILYFPVAGC